MLREGDVVYMGAAEAKAAIGGGLPRSSLWCEVDIGEPSIGDTAAPRMLVLKFKFGSEIVLLWFQRGPIAAGLCTGDVEREMGARFCSAIE